MSDNLRGVVYNHGMETKVEIVYSPDLSTGFKLSLFADRVSAGFPSPASDYEEGKLDLNRYLVKNQASTFFVRVTGDSMEGAGIYSGDMLIVDRSLEPRDGKIVIAVVDGELTVKRIRISKNKKKVVLEPENENYPPQEILPGSDFEVWGVVTNVIHAV